MDRNTVIGLTLIFALLVGFSWWTRPSKEEIQQLENQKKEAVAEAQRAADSIASMQAIADTTKVQTTHERDRMNIFSGSMEGENKEIHIQNDVFTLTLQTLGGTISDVELTDFLTWDKQPLHLLQKEHTQFYLNFFANNRSVRTDKLHFHFTGNASDLKVNGDDSLQVAMRLYPDLEDGLDMSRYVEFVYTIRGSEYMIGYKINFVGMQDLIAANANFIDLHWNAELQQLEKALQMERTNTAVYFKPATDNVDYLSETKDDQKQLTTPTKWISFKQQFFSTTLISNDDKGFPNANIENHTLKVERAGYNKNVNALIGLPYNHEQAESFDMSMYMGPNKFRILRDYNLDLERQIPLGWSFFLLQWINRFAVIPVFDFLQHSGLSYGIIILILTILLKIILLPIAYKSYLSSAKMRVIKPEVDELGKKFPKPEQAMDKQRAVMALYKKAGINTMAGCIPMLLQFPILIAMFRFFPASIELRQQPFLWADDLSSYDSIINLGVNIPFYGDHVSLFALLMAITNLLYTRFSLNQQAGAMMPGMKMMMYIMPVMFLGFLNSYSAGLNYYYVISTCLTFAQMWVIRLFIDDAKIHKQIQENKKKPVKVSKFQERLEKMAKQQQIQQQQRKK